MIKVLDINCRIQTVFGSNDEEHQAILVTMIPEYDASAKPEDTPYYDNYFAKESEQDDMEWDQSDVCVYAYLPDNLFPDGVTLSTAEIKCIWDHIEKYLD